MPTRRAREDYEQGLTENGGALRAALSLDLRSASTWTNRRDGSGGVARYPRRSASTSSRVRGATSWA